ncbi:transcriptional regulator, DeoR family [Thermanaeromonas toyohensis ToBE]|uniref:Transcriptional regulator, DeoR family n=1 Tax=Thermanaeromonas toyohensis ToBE TaxID=698762 RepID=A0A1W1VVI8_9FIRM|nr:DeoR/GlpR family DNA-binding transcription regulator [Thermanaeromonas toyohensis]SMB97379.1 transcriptional regulator, DeoR family [Thermanaeromonas toyohensis ToBE]
MISAQRKKIIIDKIKAGLPISVKELSRELGVSPMTIRRDLDALEKEGLLTRIHGGAIPINGGIEDEPSFNDRTGNFPREKLAIAQKAAELIQKGDSIFLGGGTTVTALANLLIEREDITVVTNAVNIAMILAPCEKINLIVTGGTVRTKSYSLVGALAERVLREIHVDKAFLGVDGISIDYGLTTPNMTEAHTDSLIVEAAKNVIILADHSKIGRVTLARFASISAIDILITDKGAPQDFLEELKKMDIQVLVV